MSEDEGALRRKVEETQAKLVDAREKYAKKPTDAAGKQLLKAREAASEALSALWDAAPNEKPPTQRLM